MRIEEDVSIVVEGRRPGHHRFLDSSGKELGTLVSDSRKGGEFRFDEDAFLLERGKGLVRTYFQMWDRERQWVGATYRWNALTRKVVVLVANALYNLQPTEKLGRGVRLLDGKAEEVLRIVPAGCCSRSARVEVRRRIDLPSVVLVYFVYRRMSLESVLPKLRISPATRT